MVFSARTDLAIEAAAMMGRKPDDRVEGVTVENYTNSSVSVTKVCIENEKRRRNNRQTHRQLRHP